MDNLNEEIDLVLAESLLEIDFRNIQVDKTAGDEQLEKGEKLFYGLNKETIKELNGLFRLVATLDLLQTRGSGASITTRAIKSVLDNEFLYPDFKITPPKAEKIETVLKTWLNLSRRPRGRNKYRIPQKDEAGNELSIDDMVGWGNERLNSARKFILGIQPIKIEDEEYNLNFKEYIGVSWQSGEEKMTEEIKALTRQVIEKLKPLLPKVSQPLSSAITEDILPSEVLKKESNFYTKMVGFLQKNSSDANKRTNAYQELYSKKIEEYIEKYKTNVQEDGTYNYDGPKSNGFSKAVWDRFIEYLNSFKPILDKAQEDYRNIIRFKREQEDRARRPSRRRSSTSGPVTEVLNEFDNTLQERDLTTIVIDLNKMKQQKLDESFLAMFGGWVEKILDSMFGGKSLPIAVRGSESDVKSFARTLNGEKSYLDAVRRYGLDHPTTYKNKAKLDNAIKGFERETGLKWPFN
tara:strand:- start:4040 stop:5431 length:1392 start_codon:yes stop_codon:yes gene_type:complete